jgi:GNAT superfamily N-acetyltransferase
MVASRNAAVGAYVPKAKHVKLADARKKMLLVTAAFLPLPRVRVGPRGGLARLSATEEYAVRRCDMADSADAAAYRAVSQSRDTLARPGVVQDAPERTVSVRWSTSASVTVLIAVSSEQATDAIVASLEMIGPLEASGALPRRCLLRDVWVAEAHRRRGLARRLMLAAEESVSSQGVWRRS